jgi:PAS domain S-box-containing protein
MEKATDAQDRQPEWVLPVSSGEDGPTARPGRAAYLVAGAATAVAVLVRWLLDPWLGDYLPFPTLYGAVAVAVWFGGYRPALLAAVVGYLACDWLFAEPRGAIGLDSARSVIGLGAYLVSCGIIVGFGEAMHAARRRSESRQRELERAVELRGQAEQALADFIRCAPFGIALFDGRMRYLRVNDPLAEMNGVPARDHVGKTVAEVVPGLSPTAEEVFRQVIKSGQPVLGKKFEGGTARAPGVRRWWEENWFPLFGPGGQPTAVGVIVQEITGRRRAEAERAELLARLNALIAHAPVGIALFDPDLRFIDLNDEAAAVDGIPKETHLGRRVSELLPELGPQVEALLRQVRATGRPVIGAEVSGETPAAPGQRRHWLANYFPLRNGTEHPFGVGAVALEVTQRKQAEEERQRLLLELEAKSRFIEGVVRQLPVGVLVAEVGTGRLLLSNDEAGRISGVRYEPGRPVSENDDRYPMQGFQPDGRRYGTDDWPLTRALRGETVQGEEIELLRGDGSRLTIRVNATPIRDPAGAVTAAVVAFHDVTAEKQAQARLRQSEALYRTLGEAAPDLVWSCDPDGKADYVNRRWLEYTGLTLERVNEVGWEAVNHPDDRAPLAERWAEAARRGEVFEAEFRYRRHDGEYRWFLGRAAAVRDDAGGIARWVGTSTDITDLRRVEGELRQRMQELQTVLDTIPVPVNIAYDPACHAAIGNRAAYELLRVPGGGTLSKSAPTTCT